MKDYTDLGLNKNLRSIDSLGSATSRAFVRGSDFDIRNDRGIISSAKIKNLAVTTAKIDDLAVTSAKILNFSFNSGTGGTLTLGGAGNGNGVMLVKDSGGTTKVTADNTGITINDGKLTFLNTGGGTVLDGSGLVSSTNFVNEGLDDNTTFTTSSTTLVDVTGAALASLVVSRDVNALVYLVTYGRNEANSVIDSNGACEAQVHDSFLGTLVVNNIFTGIPATDISWGAGGTIISEVRRIQSQLTTNLGIVNIQAGTHTYKLQLRANTTGTANLFFYSFGYALLGI